MRRNLLLAFLICFSSLRLLAQECIDTADNSLTILTKTNFGGADCLYTVRFCVKKITSDAKTIDYYVSATYGTMTRTINVSGLPPGSIICEAFTFVADCNSSASFIAEGKKANGTICGTVADFIILPIRLMEFNASKVNSTSALINWKTATEVNASHFVVQQSTDGRNFRDVTKVRAAGTSRAELAYEQEVRLVSNTVNYFRLAMVDKDGTTNFSSIVSIGLRGGRPILTPSPTSGYVQITGSDPSLGTNSIEVFDFSGRKMEAIKIISNREIDMSHLDAGIYFVKVGEYSTRIIKE